MTVYRLVIVPHGFVGDALSYPNATEERRAEQWFSSYCGHNYRVQLHADHPGCPIRSDPTRRRPPAGLWPSVSLGRPFLLVAGHGSEFFFAFRDPWAVTFQTMRRKGLLREDV